MEPTTFPSTPKSLRLIRAYVEQAAQWAGLDGRRAYRLMLAVEEVASNIIEHGYAGKAETGPIHLAVRQADSFLAVAVEDEGQPYDLSASSLPDVSLPLSERNRGGLGNFLVLKNVDEFRYERIGNRNCNTLLVSVA